ncbi:MAG: ATP-dependent DNA helicase RecG [Eggerthellaceae bacterium]|nr:ATP-dependent DNA helicase RecG [Eggerthellaceae bacterium]
MAAFTANSSDKRLNATLSLEAPVTSVRLISAERARMLSSMGIHSVRDLLSHYPRRYIDLSSVQSTQSAMHGQMCSVEGIIKDIKLKRPKPNLPIVEITLTDEFGFMMITAFRQPWLAKQLSAGMRVVVAGLVRFEYGAKRMANPYIEVLSESSSDSKSVGSIIPVHPATEKLSAANMRRIISNALEMTEGIYDPFPMEFRAKYGYMSRGRAIKNIHFPNTMSDMKAARARLTYDELLLLELYLMSNASMRAVGKKPFAHVYPPDTLDEQPVGECVLKLKENLPFALTQDQKQALHEIAKVMAAPKCANHMVLGDVGTGKTVLCAFAFASAKDNGCQSMFMVPTEVLCEQHAKTFASLFEGTGFKFEVLSGSTPDDKRKQIIQGFASGQIDGLIGTHALLEDDVVPHKLSLAVIDEQQRFGVEQRAKLLSKTSLCDEDLICDALYLTATPIPRSLALAIYGNLSLSYLHQKPHDSIKRTTQVFSKGERLSAYEAAGEQLEAGRQVYVVCPLIGKSTKERDALSKETRNAEGQDDEENQGLIISIEDEGDFKDDDVAAAESLCDMLSKTTFSGYEVALLHGRMRPSDKHDIMEKFRKGKIDVLVSTTVIEVGVDVPNASVMIIEDADRFGLSQLHQLRGRVGRGEHEGFVYLISASASDKAIERLSAMEKTDDGFELAEFDLSLRREGDILGNRQSGMSALKLVNIIRDKDLIEAARSDAASILDKDPFLKSEEYRLLGYEMHTVYKDELSVMGG